MRVVEQSSSTMNSLDNKQYDNQQHVITALTTQKKKPWQTSIFVDGEFWRSCNTELVHELCLYENKVIDGPELNNVLIALEKKRALDRALLILSYRDRSSHELNQKLNKAGFSNDVVTETIGSLKEYGYVDDRNFSKAWVQSRADTKLYGKKRIRQELIEKGLSENIINDTFSEIALDESEMERALKLAQKKLSSLNNLEKTKAFRRLGQYLFRKGYSSDIVYTVCRRVLEHESDDSL
jgi:regulatory protein